MTGWPECRPSAGPHRPTLLTTQLRQHARLCNIGQQRRVPAGQAAAHNMSGPPLAAASGMAVENDLEKVTIAPSEGAASLAQDNNTAADYYNLSYSHCECIANFSADTPCGNPSCVCSLCSLCVLKRSPGLLGVVAVRPQAS